MSTTTKSSSIKKEAFANYVTKGIDYHLYQQQMAEDLSSNPDAKTKEYINLNTRRMQRVEKTFIPGDKLMEQVKKLTNKIYWLIITEHWCGDAAQTIPAFKAIADMSEGKIEMKLVYRDQNDELMNSYLTNGTRSIPKLIQLDTQYNVTAIWGPRPTTAQQLVKQLKANPATAATYGNELHGWYAKNKQQSLAAEIITLLDEANIK